MVKRYILRVWAARGAPNGHFLTPFWHLLGHLGAPDPPVDAPWAPLRHICGPAGVFAAFWLPKGPQPTRKPGQQWNGKHSGKQIGWV